MSSTAWVPPRRQSSSNMKDDDAGLTQSLSQMSLSNQPASNSPRQPPDSYHRPLKPPSRRTSPSPRRRAPSRSPSHGPSSRATTPPLLRKASMNSLHSTSGAGPGRTSRRSSTAQAVSPSLARTQSFGNTAVEAPKPPLTAESVASNYFQAELEAHHMQESLLQSQTVVVLHDAVYGHRFSRPRTSRNALSTIVERPERIKAGVLGVSLAYVRLGDRHCEGANPVHPKRDVHSLANIPFRIRKSTRRLPLTSQAVTNVHGTKWMEELTLMCETAESTLAMGGKELQRPEMARDAPAEKLHEGDLYLCSESLNAMEGALGAVCDAVDLVLGPRPGPCRAFVGVRPPGHHCSADHPSGFCWVNNVHVGIMHAILTHGLTHAAIIDFDLHHGDGSQAITWQHNTRSHFATKGLASWKKTSIGYFSLHDINSYPCEMGDEDKVKNASLCIDNAHGQSIWNVHLEPWKTESDFWTLYETKYAIILEKTRKYLRDQVNRLSALGQAPKAAIFFSAGFDASEWESAGMQRHQVNVPTEFYARLTRDIVKLASEEGLGTDGRVISVLEGGYSDRALFSGVFSHISGLVHAEAPVQAPQVSNGLAYEMGQKLGTLSDGPEIEAIVDETVGFDAYDPGWWASQQLDKLERCMENPSSPPRAPRTSTPPTYFTPTAASSAKVVDPVRMRRSLSGLSSNMPKPRPVSPVAPEVPWTVAAHELSKLLIPSDRQTDSCKPEDLNAEASRARRDRQSNLMGIPPLPSVPVERPPSKMALRERRARPIGPIDEELEQTPRSPRKLSTPAKRATSRPSKTRPVAQEPGPQSMFEPHVNGRPSSRRSSRRLSETPALLSPDKEEPVPPLPTGYENMASRPATSGSSRPDSALSGQAQSNGKLEVKKSRSQSATRKENAPQTPRASRRTTPAGKSRTTAKPKPVPPVTNTMPASEPAAPSVDKITSGMKKIKINLITPAQKEARERERKQSETASEGSSEAIKPEIRVRACPDTETAKLEPVYPSTAEASPLQPGPSDVEVLGVAQSPDLGMSSPAEDDSTFDIPSPLGDKGEAHAKPLVIPRTPDHFISYQPEGPEPSALPRQEALQWLPPNVPTPSGSSTFVATPIPKKSDLFHYKSGIPFAPRGSFQAQRQKNEQKQKLSTEPESEIKEEPAAESLGGSLADAP